MLNEIGNPNSMLGMLLGVINFDKTNGGSDFHLSPRFYFGSGERI